MFKKRGASITFNIGQSIPFQQISELSLPRQEKSTLIRRHLYRLPTAKPLLFITPETLSAPQNPHAVQQALQQSELLGNTTDGKKIYLYDYQENSLVMLEIGRLREISFRAVGEGTGKAYDLDHYDQHYRHLVLWDNDALEIAGAYRLADTHQLHAAATKMEIYSQALFQYNQQSMPAYFAQGIELGRSFVSPQYWGKRSLDYLWQGIGAYLKHYPNARYLFGPVSLSDDYPAQAKALIVTFYQHYFPDTAQLAIARTPYHIPDDLIANISAAFVKNDYATDFKTLRAQLSHMDVSIPTLYKQYADLCETGGVRFIDFNIDAEFSNCIDGLVLVDLQQLKPKKRARYLQT